MTWFTDEQVEKAADAVRAFAQALGDDRTKSGDRVSIEVARAALSAVNPYEWRDIATAPKDGSFILTFAGDMAVQVTVGNWVENDADISVTDIAGTWRDDGAEPTHWMPLPPAPEGDK